MKTNKHGFVNRSSNAPTFYAILFLAFLCIVFLMYDVFHPYHTKTKPVTKIVKQQDSILTPDKAIINNLIPILMKREGLRLKPYYSKGYFYIGYGHQIKCDEENYMYGLKDTCQALTILTNDIRNSYYEMMRINRKTEQKSIFNIFISGKK